MKKDLRISLTKQLLKNGLLRIIREKTISKISVSELCREAGINRATFYNHYDTPADVLRDIAEDYFTNLSEIYDKAKKNYVKENSAEENAVEENVGLKTCLVYLYEKKDEIEVLLSKNTENNISSYGMDIINKLASQKAAKYPGSNVSSSEDDFLYAVLTASAAYGLIAAWLTMNIDKTPEEIIDFLRRVFPKV